MPRYARVVLPFGPWRAAALGKYIRPLSSSDVMGRKVRRAAETGEPFTRVRDLYL